MCYMRSASHIYVICLTPLRHLYDNSRSWDRLGPASTTAGYGSTGIDACLCDTGFYLPGGIPFLHGPNCTACPEGGSCSKGVGHPFPEKDFYLSEHGSFLECELKDTYLIPIQDSCETFSTPTSHPSYAHLTSILHLPVTHVSPV